MKMKPKYVQLPPLPIELPTESMEIIWLYARMSQEEKEKVQEFMRENLKGSAKDIQKTELLTETNDIDVESDSDIAEFTSLMQQLIGTLIAEACEMAAIVYRYYYVNGKTVEEISQIINVPEDTIQLMSQYYDRKNKL